MSKISFIKRAISFLTVAVMLCALLPAGAFAADSGELILVGASPDFGINKYGTEYSGIAYDYLEQMKKYTHHRYTYIDGTPDQLMEMLDNGKLDIIPCVSAGEYEMYFGENDQSDVKASLLDYSVMRKYSAIYVPDKTDSIAYYDLTSLKKAKIGYLADNERKYFSEDGAFICTEVEDATFIKYNTESQLKADFFDGNIDAVVKECFRPWGNEAAVYQFNMEECTFLANNSITEKLNSALGSVTITDAYFASDMYEKYVSRYGAQKFAFSSAERAYIEKKVGINIAYNLQSDMLNSYNKSKRSITGVMGEMIEDIEQLTGLSVTIVPAASMTETLQMLEDGEVDAVCGGINNHSTAGYNGILVTTPVLRIPVVIAGKANTTITDHSKIAVPFYGKDIESYAKALYPSATFLPYADVKQCMDAVLSGEADVLCAGAYEVIYMKNGGYDRISILAPLNAYHSECFAIKSDSSELCSIFGKALAQMGSTDSDIRTFDSMTSYGYDAMTLSRFVDKYLIAIILFAALIVVEIIIHTFLVRRNTKRTIEIDKLTGGRTKQKFIDDSLKALRKTSPEQWAVVLFDINKFKYVNDRLGYDEGNNMLQRLYKTVADYMEDDEVFSRISDDNFAMTVHNAPDNELASRVNSIFDEFARRNSLFVKYPVLFSAGVCRLGQCVDKDGTVDINAALDRASLAKKTRKGQHRTSISFYDGKIREKALREKDYENVMPTALKRREFICYIQPKYGLKSRHIEGAEALIRWNSKEFGFVYPDQFIPLSEKNGFVVELDFYILEEVCMAMRRWIDDGKTPVVISVNQSRLHLNNDDYIWRLREIVDKYEIPYEYIELELTESVFTEDTEHLLAIMQKLHEIGFKLSIDDFGSGYSSLNMLKDIPADVIKIDREFFNGTVNSEKGRAVIETVVGLAKNLNMEVISEGVETSEQVDFLSDIDCHMVQGYYFSKPMPIPAFEEMWYKDLELQKQEQEAAAKEQEAAEAPQE